jgi:alkyl sulfatase BDS1-like metallo-beta-lactamase superfamily hydrolase
MQSKDATSFTRLLNETLLKSLPFQDRQDFEEAGRGLIHAEPLLEIRGTDNRKIWSLEDYQFESLDSGAPHSVNPSLWRMAQLNTFHGLFKVVDRIYQVRGYDLSNMTIIEGESKLIVIDPLVSTEVAKAALDLFFRHRPRKEIAAVIYTHSHIDHFGGVRGVISEDDVPKGKVEIYAPKGFMEHAISENLYAGNAMKRRATYMYGPFLPKGIHGQVDGGLGKTTSTGTISLIAPTKYISKTGEKIVIDGVDFVFQYTPDTEAPAEMNFYLPQFKALCAAENACSTMHNLYTIRGAQVRDARAWSHYLNETINLFGDAEVVFVQHHWPKWGKERIQNFLKKQRDLYKFMHDQTLRLLNHGLTPLEISEQLELPPTLASEWFNRGYYGSLSHNVKAVYQKYIGWYDGNPANLHALPPQDAACKYVEFMAGAKAILANARTCYEKGEYRWVAQVLNHVIFADPDNAEAKELQSDALEQLGYQSECAPWRNSYLMAAYELRSGVPTRAGETKFSIDFVHAMSVDMIFDYMAVLLNGEKAKGKKITVNWVFTDIDQKYSLVLDNSVLNHESNTQLPDADVTVTTSRTALDEVFAGNLFQKITALTKIQVKGKIAKLVELMSLLDTFDPWFNIVTP